MENTCNRHATEYSRLIHNESITVKYNTILHNNYNTNYQLPHFHFQFACLLEGKCHQLGSSIVHVILYILFVILCFPNIKQC